MESHNDKHRAAALGYRPCWIEVNDEVDRLCSGICAAQVDRWYVGKILRLEQKALHVRLRLVDTFLASVEADPKCERVQAQNTPKRKKNKWNRKNKKG